MKEDSLLDPILIFLSFLIMAFWIYTGMNHPIGFVAFLGGFWVVSWVRKSRIKEGIDLERIKVKEEQ